MRTTITLADDVAAAVDRLTKQEGRGISATVNDLIRRGLTVQEPAGRFVQATGSMGQPMVPVDDVAGLLDTLDGPAHR